MAGESVANLGGTAEELLNEFLLGDENELVDEDRPLIDGLGSGDDIEEGRFSCTEAERTFRARPVLEAANRLRADLRQEGSTPKVTGSLELATDRAEDPGVEFKHNIAFMRETLPKEAVPQPAPVQPRAVPMSVSQAETPKAEVPFSLFVKAKFIELSTELAGCLDTLDSAHSGEGLPRG